MLFCRVHRFDPYTCRVSAVYHSLGQSFNAGSPLSGSPCSYCRMASRHTLRPERRLKFGILMPGMLTVWEFCGVPAEACLAVSDLCAESFPSISDGGSISEIIEVTAFVREKDPRRKRQTKWNRDNNHLNKGLTMATKIRMIAHPTPIRPT